MIKRIVCRIIQNFGYDKKFAFVSMSTALVLKRIASRGITIRTVIDVGASIGSWSLEEGNAGRMRIVIWSRRMNNTGRRLTSVGA